MEMDIGRAARAAIRVDKRFDMIANQLANVATTGYKAENVSFDDHFRARMYIDMSQGSIEPTGNPLDMALSGQGFFTIQTPKGIRYTRNGTFMLDQKKYLVTQNGNRVMGQNGPIRLNGTHVTVDRNGQIDVDGTPAGKLKIVTFKDLQNFKKEGDDLFVHKGGAAGEVTPKQVNVVQNALEQSNVSTVMGMTRMIEVNREFESFQKVIQTYDNMDTKAATEVGSVK